MGPNVLSHAPSPTESPRPPAPPFDSWCVAKWWGEVLKYGFRWAEIPLTSAFAARIGPEPEGLQPPIRATSAQLRAGRRSWHHSPSTAPAHPATPWRGPPIDKEPALRIRILCTL